MTRERLSEIEEFIAGRKDPACQREDAFGGRGPTYGSGTTSSSSTQCSASSFSPHRTRPRYRGLSAISRRVMTLVQLYDHVIGTGLSRTIDFNTYLTDALHQIRIQESAQHSKVKLTCQAEPVALDLDSATTLGLVVSQLIANSYARVSPDNTGTISVSLHRGSSGDDATIIIADDSVRYCCYKRWRTARRRYGQAAYEARPVARRHFVRIMASSGL